MQLAWCNGVVQALVRGWGQGVHAELPHDADDLECPRAWFLVRGPVAHPPPDWVATPKHAIDEARVDDDPRAVLAEVGSGEIAPAEDRLLQRLEVSDVHACNVHEKRRRWCTGRARQHLDLDIASRVRHPGQ